MIPKELEILLLLNSDYRKCACCLNYYHHWKTRDILAQCNALTTSPRYNPDYCLLCYPQWRHIDQVSKIITDDILKLCYHPELVPFKTRQERLIYIADKFYVKK